MACVVTNEVFEVIYSTEKALEFGILRSEPPSKRRRITQEDTDHYQSSSSTDQQSSPSSSATPGSQQTRQPLIEQNCNTTPVRRQISKVPFADDMMERFDNSISGLAKSYMRGERKDDGFARKEMKTALVNFCMDSLPESRDQLENREFYSRLKSSLYAKYPNFPGSFGDVLLNVSNSVRQRWFTKLHGIKVRLSPYGQRKNTVVQTIGVAETVLSRDELLKDAEDELSKAKPDIKHLQIVNRNLFDGAFHDAIPARLSFSATLIFEEFIRLYPKHKNLLANAEEFLKRNNLHTMEDIESIQEEVSHSRVSQFITRVSDETFEKELKRRSKFGPEVLFSTTRYGVRSRNGVEFSATFSCLAESLAVGLVTYYIMDLTYPSAFAQMLGLLQEALLEDPFLHKNKRLKKVLYKLNGQ